MANNNGQPELNNFKIEPGAPIAFIYRLEIKDDKPEPCQISLAGLQDRLIARALYGVLDEG